MDFKAFIRRQIQPTTVWKYWLIMDGLVFFFFFFHYYPSSYLEVLKIWTYIKNISCLFTDIFLFISISNFILTSRILGFISGIIIFKLAFMFMIKKQIKYKNIQMAKKRDLFFNPRSLNPVVIKLVKS